MSFERLSASMTCSARNRLLIKFCSLCLFSAVGSAQQLQPSAGTLRPLDPRVMDLGADPCVDFAKFACGNFNKLYPIRADEMESSPGASSGAQIRAALKGILVNDASPGEHTPEERLLGDYYTACMDVDAVDAKGLTALRPLLLAIDAFSDKSQLPALLAEIQMVQGDSFFRVYAFADELHANQTIAVVDQAGFGLQTGENYMSKDAKAVALRQQYVAHIAALLALSGKNAQHSRAVAENIVSLEVQLVGKFPEPAIRRDPVARYHAFTLDELEHLTPALGWRKYFAGIGVKYPIKINVWSPAYIQRVEEVINTSNLETLRSFLRWRVLSSIPGVDLPVALDDEKFSFEGRIMLGMKQQAPRERRCLSSITSDIPGPVSSAVIHQMFSADEIRSVDQMVAQVEAALTHEIDGLSWMGPDTKLQAKRKVDAITNNIVRLDPWNGWSAVTVTQNDPLANYLKAAQLNAQRTFQRIGQPADKTELAMSPIYSGAYWTNSRLSMNVNAGSILPPSYDATSTIATNYGHLGAVIGHEITHGFDNSGAHYDYTGSLADWWSADDKRKFDEKASCFVQEYSNFAEGDLHVNGELTLGENIADNGGLRLAYLAMLEAVAKKRIALADRADGFTPEQQFFIAFGQEYCGATRPERERVLMLTDPHSLDQFRVNGSVQNMRQFGNAFSCKVGQPMMPAKTCQIW
ncbi:M13-type metalloendopeptidase [Acidicapsa ligni]|uniref:M13-type metalloendopeptidase n=1 Tax=Acidicapsa ligni TaxID=542300 RepID=UPI0021DF4C94|nr:M13 family metallopeptidase [Acidicapsa ligni]